MKDFVYAAGGRTPCPSLTTASFLCLRWAPAVGCCSVMTLVPWATEKTPHSKTKVFSIKLDWAGSSRGGSLRFERNTNKHVLRARILQGQFVALHACLSEHPSPGCTTDQKHSCKPGDLRAQRGGKKQRKTQSRQPVGVVSLYAVMLCPGRCFNWRWAVGREEEFMSCLFCKQKVHLKQTNKMLIIKSIFF